MTTVQTHFGASDQVLESSIVKYVDRRPARVFVAFDTL
jgi:hypothetical protein